AEHALHVAALPAAARPQVIEALMKLDRPLQRLDDLAQRDSLSRPRQPEPAAEAAPRTDQPLGRQSLKDLRQERLRDRRGARDVVAREMSRICAGSPSWRRARYRIPSIPYSTPLVSCTRPIVPPSSELF